MITSKKINWAGATPIEVSLNKGSKPIGIVLPTPDSAVTFIITPSLKKGGVTHGIYNKDGQITINMPALTAPNVVIFPSDVIFGCDWADSLVIASSVTLYGSGKDVEVLFWDGD